MVLLFTTSIFAQDILLKEDGTKVECKIKEVSSSSIKYLKLSDLEGPVFVEEKNNLLGIIYQNGDFEKISVSKLESNKRYINHRINVLYLTSSYETGWKVLYEGFPANHFSWNAGGTFLTSRNVSIDSKPEYRFASIDFGAKFYTRKNSGAYGGIIFSIGDVNAYNDNESSGLTTSLVVGRQFKLSELFGLDIGYTSLLGNFSSSDPDPYESGQYFAFDSYVSLGVNFTF